MNDPYQSVLISLSISLLFLFGYITYRFLYPKRHVNLFLLMLLIAILPLLSVFRYGTYESGDFNIHVYRTMAFVEAIRDGQIMPSWPKDLNGTYGYPLFIWMNSLPYYLISFFHVFGFSFIMSTKLYLVFTYILSGITFWFFARQTIKEDIPVFTATIFYLFAPYHLLDLHFRATIGEMLSFVFLPLFLLTIHLLWEKRTFFYAMILGVIWGLFILTHHAISVFSLGLAIPYVIFLSLRNVPASPKVYLYFIFALLFGFMVSLYVWLPHVVMAQYTYGVFLQTPMVSFPHITELLYSPYRFGLLFQGPTGELSFAIGYMHIFMVGVGVILLITKQLYKTTSYLLFYMLMFFGLLFIMNPTSSFLWETIPLIKSAQFSTRLMVLMTLVTSIITGIVLTKIKINKLLLTVLILLTIGITILNWGHRKVIPEIDDTVLKNQLWLSTARGEGFYGLGNPRWIDFENQWIETKPESHIKILEGTGSATLRTRTSNRHVYDISTKSTTVIKENTLYFPGWTVSANGKMIPINPSYPTYPGIITFTLPEGNYTVEVIYQDIAILRIAKGISLFFLFGSITYFVAAILKKRNLLF